MAKHWFKRLKRNLATGLRKGFRSGLEERNGRLLETKGEPVNFEEVKIKYTVPEHRRTYTVDFRLANGILVETKGRFLPQDRAKHRLIRAQFPELDIRFVFQNPGARLYKGSPTTLKDWANKHGFRWAKGLIPKEWIEEAGPARPPEAVLADT